MSHRNVTCSNIEDHLRNKERIEPWRAIAFCEVGDFFLECDEASYAACKYNSYPVNIYIGLIDRSILYSLVTCNDGGLSKAIEFAGFLLVEKIYRIKILDLAGETRFEF